jgi:uncharacterized protein YjbI with pentapeptide repeats
LSRASLEGATLRDAHLEGADLSHSDLAQTDLLGAVYDPYTTWPVGFDPESAGARFELSS